jgi:hypothetical protein
MLLLLSAILARQTAVPNGFFEITVLPLLQ